MLRKSDMRVELDADNMDAGYFRQNAILHFPDRVITIWVGYHMHVAKRNQPILSCAHFLFLFHYMITIHQRYRWMETSRS